MTAAACVIRAYLKDEAQRVVSQRAERRVFIEAPFALKDACKALPGARWDSTRRAWHVPATVASAESIARVFGGHELQASEGVQELLRGALRAREAQGAKEAHELEDTPTTTGAWLHQRRAFHFARQLDGVMLAMDMGTGKSMVAIALCQEWDARRVLILCPHSVVGVWPKQFLTHAQRAEDWMMVAPRGKLSVAARTQALAKGIADAERLRRRVVCVVNYEAAWRDAMAGLLKDIDWDVAILDESHRVKSAGGKQSMFTMALRKHARRRLCLTGTPMPHSPLDLYAQYRFLDPGIYGTSKSRFQNRYAVFGGFEGRQVKGWQNMEEFTDKMRSIAFVVSKEDALPDLPRKMPPMQRTFRLERKAQGIYAQLEDEFVAGVEEGTIVAANALARLMRFRQITSGFAKTTEDRIVRVDEGRKRLLKEVLEEIGPGEPVVVFASFHADLDQIHEVGEELGLRVGELSGRRRDGIAEDSTMSPDIDVLACQLKSGGVGIDLTLAAYAVYFSAGYELGDYDQSSDRLHRPGQTRPVRYVHLVAEDTVDDVVYEALRARKSLVQAVIDSVRRN